MVVTGRKPLSETVAVSHYTGCGRVDPDRAALARSKPYAPRAVHRDRRGEPQRR